MKNKLLFSILFMFFILVLLSINNISSAFNYIDNRYGINADFGDIKLYNYNIVTYKDDLSYFILYSFLNVPYIEKVPDTDYYILKSNSASYIRYLYDLNDNTFRLIEDYEGTFDYNIFNIKKSDSIDVIYSDVDFYDKEGNLIFSKNDFNSVVEEPSYTYFNFTYNNVNYSLNVTHDTLRDYMSIFKVGNYAILFTSDDRPSHKYIDNTDYLSTTSLTNLYLYNLSTGDNVLYSDDPISEEYLKKYTGYFENGIDFAFHTDNLIYSNFVLYDRNGNVVFQPSELTLASVLSSVEPEKILLQIITLLPVTMVLIVGYLALRKAIAELRQKAQG